MARLAGGAVWYAGAIARPALAMHTPRLLHHNELLVRGMINLNRLHPKPWSEEEEVCVCIFVCMSKKRRGSESCVFYNSRVLFLCFFSLLTLNLFSHSRDRKGRGREGVGGVTTDVLPPSESCLFDGDSGAYHVA